MAGDPEEDRRVRRQHRRSSARCRRSATRRRPPRSRRSSRRTRCRTPNARCSSRSSGSQPAPRGAASQAPKLAEWLKSPGGDPAQEGLHRQAGGVPAAAAGGQHVVGAGAVVAERDRRVGADEDRARRCAPARPTRGRRAVWISRCSAAYASTTRRPCVEVVDQHDADCSPVSAAVTRSACLVAGTCRASSASTASASATESVTSTLAASGSCSAWLIRSAATCAGSAVSSARIAISVGPASASMPTTPRSSRLAAVDPDVARAGDQVDRLAASARRAVAPASRPPGRRRPRTPRRRRAARRRRAPGRRAGRRCPAAAGWPPRATRRRRPGRAPRSSPRWTGTRQAAGDVEADPGDRHPAAR